MRYWNGYQWKNGQAPAGSGRITECETYDEFKQVFGGRAEETDEQLKERVRDAFVPPPRSDIEGYYVGESHPPAAFPFAPCADPSCPGDHGKPSPIDSLFAVEMAKADAQYAKAAEQSTFSGDSAELKTLTGLDFCSYGEGLERRLAEIKATELVLPTHELHVTTTHPERTATIKLGCVECTFTWEEPDRDDMIVAPDHNSHFTEPCPGSGEPAVCL